MAMSLDSSDSDRCSLKSNTTWDTLYHFLGTRVRYWVRSSHVSFWRGQEEDIVADIVQEAVTSTFMYTSTYSSWPKEGEAVPCDSLKQLGAAIAYKQYQDWRRQDSRFVYTRPRRFSPQGYVVIYEQVDPLEIVVDSVVQEWGCNRLAGKIAKIPGRPRTALLIDLANRLHFDAQLTLPLQHAFLKEGIRLQDYQQPLPNDPLERSRHQALLRCAYGQIMRQREEQENTEAIHGSQDPAFAVDDIDPDALESIESNPELTALAARLDATAPPAVVDPIFRKALGNKLLDILAEYYILEAGEAVLGNVSEAASEHDSAQPANSNQDPAFAVDGIDPDALESIESDLGLMALAACLDAMAPPALANPAFRKALRDKLEGTPVGDHESEVVEKALEMTERALTSESRELSPVSVAREIGGFH